MGRESNLVTCNRCRYMLSVLMFMTILGIRRSIARATSSECVARTERRWRTAYRVDVVPVSVATWHSVHLVDRLLPVGWFIRSIRGMHQRSGCGVCSAFISRSNWSIAGAICAR